MKNHRSDVEIGLPTRGLSGACRSPEVRLLHQPQFPGSPPRVDRQAEQAQGAPAARARRPRSGRDRGDAAHAGDDPPRVRALRLRAGRDAADRIHRRARQIPARPRPAERGRVLVPGRRRAVALAALRLDRAARALRGGEFRAAAEALSQLPRGMGVPQREAGPWALSPIHAVRRRHRGLGLNGRRCRDVHDGRRHHGGAGHSARQLCGEGEQSQGAGRSLGIDRARWRGECGQTTRRVACDRQIRSIG